MRMEHRGWRKPCGWTIFTLIRQKRHENGGKDDMDEVKLNIYDIEETYPNCTVQILKNSITGEKSIGWKKNNSFNCFRCGEKLWWECDYSYEDYDMDGDGLVTTYQCPNCGARMVTDDV